MSASRRGGKKSIFSWWLWELFFGEEGFNVINYWINCRALITKWDIEYAIIITSVYTKGFHPRSLGGVSGDISDSWSTSMNALHPSTPLHTALGSLGECKFVNEIWILMRSSSLSSSNKIYLIEPWIELPLTIFAAGVERFE